MSPTFVAATFPALSPEAVQNVAEAHRAERLTVLAAALSTTPDSALGLLAASSGLPLLADPVVDSESLRVLPARLVHEYQLVPVKDPAAPAATDASTIGHSSLDIGHSSEEEATASASLPLHLATAWPASPEIADWIATFTPRALVWHLAAADRVKELIVANYGVGGGSLDEELADLGPD